jgi:hypothetical protein
MGQDAPLVGQLRESLFVFGSGALAALARLPRHDEVSLLRDP